MKRLVLLIVSPIVLVIGLWQMWSGLVEIFPSIRQDHQISAAAADAGKAASDFNSLAKDAFETGKPPRQTDPGAKALLDRVFGTDVLAHRTIGEPDLGPTAEWSMSIVKTGMIYILAGTGISDFTKATNDPKLAERINQNVVTFAPELGRYLDAQLAVMGGMLDAIGASMAGGKTTNAKVESGLEKVRRGITSTLSRDAVDRSDRGSQRRMASRAASRLGGRRSQGREASARRAMPRRARHRCASGRGAQQYGSAGRVALDGRLTAVSAMTGASSTAAGRGSGSSAGWRMGRFCSTCSL